MNRNFLLKLSPGILLLAACTSIDTLDQQIQANIDPEIQGEERAVIAEHMRYLKPEDWKAVTYITNGKVYVNRVQLRGILEVAQPVGNNVYRLSDGTTFPIPVEPEDELVSYQTTTCASSSGPFRRVRTRPGGGTTAISRFAYAGATISPGGLLFGDDSPPRVTTGTPGSALREVAYAYLGTSPNSATGLAESDAGLQWSPANNNWAPYVLSGGVLVTASRNNTRYVWYGETTMTLRVIADGKARITYSGTVAANSSNTVNPYPVDFDVAGIKLNGLGNVLKRVTSIAQIDRSGNPIFNQTSGATYTLGWSNLRLGLTESSGLHIWGQTALDVAENCVTAKTQVGATGSGSEEVFINLR